MKKKRKLNKKNLIIIICLFLVLVSICVGIYFFYDKVYLNKVNDISLELNGKDTITINLLDEYYEQGAKASFRDEDISNLIDIETNLDNTKVGTFEVKYKVNYQDKQKEIIRNIKVVDIDVPKIKLKGKADITVYLGVKYEDPGVTATDNYDGDISDKVEIDSKVNTNEIGNYVVNYKVKDSSGNENFAQRTVKVVKRPIVHRDGVAVLNYHFFYKGSSCGINCINIDKFEEQLKYLNENGYKTLTMDEFRKWMYGEISVPQKSVLITIDDGAAGTGKHNGNLLIPALEKYQAHATLFLITGWWDISNYKSEYLDIESHTNDMHKENQCQGVQRGAQMLCSSYEEVLADLKKSIVITNSTNAFCFPFYVYNESTLNAVKEAGFKLAFVGGNYKATKSSNKYLIPRFHIYDSITMDEFISYIA